MFVQRPFCGILAQRKVSTIVRSSALILFRVPLSFGSTPDLISQVGHGLNEVRAGDGSMQLEKVLPCRLRQVIDAAIEFVLRDGEVPRVGRRSLGFIKSLRSRGVNWAVLVVAVYSS